MSVLLRFVSRPGSRPVARIIPALQLASLVLLSTLYLAKPIHAATGEDVVLTTPEAIAQLEQRASQANPREQAFLYTELVHTMTVKAGKEISDGEDEKAAATLKQINQYAHLIHMNLARDTKRLKNAELLMHHTTYHLAQFLHLVSAEDQQTVKETLKQLDQVNDELLTQVFAH